MSFIITVPDIRKHLFADAGTVILYGKVILTVLHFLMDHDFLAVPAVIDRVGDQVIDDLCQLDLVPVDQYRIDRFHANVELALQQLFDTVTDLLYLGNDVKCRDLQRLHACLQLADIQDLIDETGQPVGLIDDDLYVFRIVLSRNIPHHLAISADHRQWCTQIMAHVRNQLLAEIFDLFQLPRRIVQRFIQLVDLHIFMVVKVNIVVSQRQLPRLFIRRADRTGNLTGNVVSQCDCHRNDDDSDHKKLELQRGDRRLHR